MRDFRSIRKFEVDWKNAQQQAQEAKTNLGQASASPETRGGGVNLEELLDELADQS